MLLVAEIYEYGVELKTIQSKRINGKDPTNPLGENITINKQMTTLLQS